MFLLYSLFYCIINNSIITLALVDADDNAQNAGLGRITIYVNDTTDDCLNSLPDVKKAYDAYMGYLARCKDVGINQTATICHCDPVCDFCMHSKGNVLDSGSSWCRIQEKEVDWSDTACKYFFCPDCGNSYKSFISKKE